MLILRLFPVWLKGISAGSYVDLALAYSLGAGLTPDVTCTFDRDDGTGSRREVGCPGVSQGGVVHLFVVYGCQGGGGGC